MNMLDNIIEHILGTPLQVSPPSYDAGWHNKRKCHIIL